MTLDYTVRSPLRHVLRAYDRAIHACEVMDAPAAIRAIALLRESHAGNSAESLGFESIFVWCERALDDGDYAEPARRLTSLRNAWATTAGVPTAGTPATSRSAADVPHLRLVVGNA